MEKKCRQICETTTLEFRLIKYIRSIYLGFRLKLVGIYNLCYSIYSSGKYFMVNILSVLEKFSSHNIIVCKSQRIYKPHGHIQFKRY